jgi:hypothetical protein
MLGAGDFTGWSTMDSPLHIGVPGGRPGGGALARSNPRRIEGGGESADRDMYDGAASDIDVDIVPNDSVRDLPKYTPDNHDGSGVVSIITLASTLSMSSGDIIRCGMYSATAEMAGLTGICCAWEASSQKAGSTGDELVDDIAFGNACDCMLGASDRILNNDRTSSSSA